MQSQQPIAFDIDLGKVNSAPAPEVKRRLENADRKPLTLEQINARQSRAAEKRAIVLENQKNAAHSTVEKVELNRDRRTSEERASEQRLAQKLDAKLKIADEKRQVQLESIQDKARTHNKRVCEKVEAISATLEKDSSAKKSELELKMKKASESREKQIESVKQTAAQSAVMKGTVQSPKKGEPQL